MGMVSSGQIQLGGSNTSGSLNRSVARELGLGGTAQADINASSFRTLAGKSSGQIKLSDFYSKGVFLSDLTLSHIYLPEFGETGACGIYVYRNGNLGTYGNFSDTPSATQWIDPDGTTIGDSYYVKLISATGTALNVGDSKNTWLALSTSRSWGYDYGIPVSGTSTLQISRDASTVLASCTLTHSIMS